jgi:pimeloyl-ACP methyl ester carboxylesterase
MRLGAEYIRTAFSLPIYDTAAKYQGPALIIHGTGDRVVPYTYGERFHQIWDGSELVIIDKADHGFSQQIEQVAGKSAEFLSKVLLSNK